MKLRLFTFVFDVIAEAVAFPSVGIVVAAVVTEAVVEPLFDILYSYIDMYLDGKWRPEP